MRPATRPRSAAISSAPGSRGQVRARARGACAGPRLGGGRSAPGPAPHPARAGGSRRRLPCAAGAAAVGARAHRAGRAAGQAPTEARRAGRRAARRRRRLGNKSARRRRRHEAGACCRAAGAGAGARARGRARGRGLLLPPLLLLPGGARRRGGASPFPPRAPASEEPLLTTCASHGAGFPHSRDPPTRGQKPGVPAKVRARRGPHWACLRSERTWLGASWVCPDHWPLLGMGSPRSAGEGCAFVLLPSEVVAGRARAVCGGLGSLGGRRRSSLKVTWGWVRR